MDDAFVAIGKAVYAAQLFETALVPIFEFFRMQTESGYLDRTGGLVSEGKFKQATINVVKMLSERGEIAPGLEERLKQWIEDRHTLVHRLVLNFGVLSVGDANGFAPIAELANRVEREANSLTHMLVGYILEHFNPEADSTPEDRKRLAQEIFLRTAAP